MDASCRTSLQPNGTSDRLPYERPRLVVYGDIAGVTRMNFTMAMNDSGMGGSTRT